MRRRTSPFAIRFATELAPLLPAVAFTAFATAGALAETIVGASSAPGALNEIEDIQVGERGALFRVVVVCREECPAGPRASGVFFIEDVAAALDVDLKGRSLLAERLVFAPVQGGAEMTVRSPRAIVAASVKRCAVAGAAASCIDIEFGASAARAAAAPPPADASPPARVAGPPAAGPGAPAQAPGLREETGSGLLVFASLEPPERLAAPRARPATPPESAAPADGPRLIIDRQKAAALAGARVDIGGEAAAILGRNFDASACAGAEERLKADAWALDAMVDLGFCRALAGRLDEADGVFMRLLAYTPDNYEALVGRALVAARRGDRPGAERHFQSALNALPPIAESDRIVEAMQRL